MTTTTLNSVVNEYQNNNASIRVEWKDTIDNYSEAREAEILKYFKRKYKTERVSVKFTAILSRQQGVEVESSVDASELVLDNNYQKNLIQKYLNDHSINVNMQFLDKLDNTVNGQMENYKETTTRYKKFRIIKLWFDNFLSYGKDNNLPVEGKKGITAIVSDPANFGGKTTATIDAMLFLFFGDTTKTEVNADVFNRATNENEVVVGGEIEMEGDVLVIERTLKRVVMTSGEYKVTSSVEFKKRLARGGYKNMKGDEKKVTEQLIKEYVGTKDDFLVTILSTGDNLDKLIETKPTERGRLLTRFIGLEFFREKEKIAKRLYDDWKETAKLYKHSLEEIYTNIASFESRIEETELMKFGVDKNLNRDREVIMELVNRSVELLEKRLAVDTELYKVNEEEIVQGIKMIESRIAERKEAHQKAFLGLIRPTQEFDMDRLAMLESNVNIMNGEVYRAGVDIDMLKSSNRNLKESENCVTCKRPLEGVDYSVQIAENEKKIENLVTKISNLNKNISVSLAEVEQIKQTKVLWDEFNRQELVVSKIKFEVEQYEATLIRGTKKLSDYRANKEKVEKNRLIDTELNVIKTQLQELEERKEMALLKSIGYEKDVEMTRQRIAEYNLLVKDIKREEVIDKIYRTYLEIYGKNGISKMVLATMIPLINHHLKVLLSESAQFILELRMNEKNEVEFWMVAKGSGLQKPLVSGSGYEKTVSSLALRCVLTKVCSLPKPNIIIFDEVFSRVANENLDNIGLFFEKIRTFFEHIWLISHNPLIKDWADHLIKVRKDPTTEISQIITDK